MDKKKNALIGFLAVISACVGYEFGLADLANFAHDEITVIRKNLDRTCFYQLHESTLIAVCPRLPK
ncbi:hypothetical protein OL383_004435 [Salmonella enterica]|nr:hypothetical protein [Salmonella enterica]